MTCAVVILGLLLFLSGNSEAKVVIGPSAQKDVLALFAPFELGGEITPGWRLNNVSIRETSVVCTLIGPAEKS
jgi:hypothetical protein